MTTQTDHNSEKHFEAFKRGKEFLENCSPYTSLTYQTAWNRYRKYSSELNPEEIKKFVLHLRAEGLSVHTCNSYIRGLNSFLTWVFENHYIPEKWRAKQLKAESKVKTAPNDTDVKKLLRYRPTTFPQARIHAMVITMLETGIRVGEAFRLEKKKVDLDEMTLTVIGKGQKERTLPFSTTLKRILWRYSTQFLIKVPQTELFFPSPRGTKLYYPYTREQLPGLRRRLGLTNFEGSFHAMRRKFAKSYSLNGGKFHVLKQMMGHSSLDMALKYIEASPEELKDLSVKTSLLDHVR